MLFGAHISIVDGIDKVPAKAAQVGCECFQFFSRPPQGGKGVPLTPRLAQKFKFVLTQLMLLNPDTI